MSENAMCMILRGIVAMAEQRAMVRALNATTKFDSDLKMVDCKWINSNTGRRQAVSLMTWDVEKGSENGYESQIVDVAGYLESGVGAEVLTL